MLQNARKVLRGAAAGALGVALLTGCGASEYAAAGEFQDSVQTITQFAANGDYAKALDALHELRDELEAADSEGTVSAERREQIESAIREVEAELQAKMDDGGQSGNGNSQESGGAAGDTPAPPADVPEGNNRGRPDGGTQPDNENNPGQGGDLSEEQLEQAEERADELEKQQKEEQKRQEELAEERAEELEEQREEADKVGDGKNPGTGSGSGDGVTENGPGNSGGTGGDQGDPGNSDEGGGPPEAPADPGSGGEQNAPVDPGNSDGGSGVPAQGPGNSGDSGVPGQGPGNSGGDEDG